MALTAKKIREATKPGRYLDTNGLYLRVAPGGSAQWQYRYTFRGKARFLGLGSINKGVTLAAARVARDKARLQLNDKIDLVGERQKEKAQRRLAQAKPVPS